MKTSITNTDMNTQVQKRLRKDHTVNNDTVNIDITINETPIINCMDNYDLSDGLVSDGLVSVSNEDYERSQPLNIVSKMKTKPTKSTKSTPTKLTKSIPTGLSEKVEHNFQTIINKIRGKKVFIFDLETTGIFDKKEGFKYWLNTVFDSARIVEIGYYYSENFADPIDLESNKIIHSYLRKPTDFDSIHPEAEKKHGISMEKLQTDGYKFSQILNQDLIKKISNCDFIISHNTDFDFNILLNELHRFKLNNTIRHLIDLKTSGGLLCTCRSSGYKTLETLYELIFQSKPDVTHRAGEDVKTLVEIILKQKLNTQYKFTL
jgi:DNA polymerase III epsilon subunit-like protein